MKAKYSFIHIGEIKRPVAFSKLALMRFMEATGFTLGQMSETFSKKQEDYTAADMMAIYQLAECGFRDGLRIAKKAGEKVNDEEFTFEDVVDWLEDDEKLAEVFAIYGGQNNRDDVKKKQKPAA